MRRSRRVEYNEGMEDTSALEFGGTRWTVTISPDRRVALLRKRLARMKLLSAHELHELPHNRRVGACGIVTVRQQPQTANGTIFVTLEDETGPVNVIVWKSVREEWRDPLLRAKLLVVHGTWQRDVESGGNVCHVVAESLEDLTPMLGRLGTQSRTSSRDFH